MNVATLHEVDRFAWLEQQTRLLKAGALDELDIAHLIEELESAMGNERRELYRRLRVLLALAQLCRLQSRRPAHRQRPPGRLGAPVESRGQMLRGHGHAVWALAFSPDGRTLASGSSDDTVRLWDRTPVRS